MGAAGWIRDRLEDVLPTGVPLSYVGRPRRASPGEGHAAEHRVEQERLLRDALAMPTVRACTAVTLQEQRCA
jgi:2-oxoglutarate dehydrogenase E1 component